MESKFVLLVMRDTSIVDVKVCNDKLALYSYLLDDINDLQRNYTEFAVVETRIQPINNLTDVLNDLRTWWNNEQ